MAKLLPRLQLVFAIIFFVVPLFGPMLVSQGSLLVLADAAAGALLGVVTFLIGWRLEVSQTPVFYPFTDWSRGILKLFLNPAEGRGLRSGDRDVPPRVRKAIGILSLGLGTLLVVALIIVTVLVLSA